jgi:hypothetical protein
MTADEYKLALDAACREYEQLGQKRADIERRLSQLAQTISNLIRLCGYTPTVSIGLTDGIRMALAASGRPMTPTEVRDALAGFGFDVSKYANDLAAIHTVLKRLNQSGELRLLPREGGKHAYVAARHVHFYSMPVFGSGVTPGSTVASHDRADATKGRTRKRRKK